MHGSFGASQSTQIQLCTPLTSPGWRHGISGAKSRSEQALDVCCCPGGSASKRSPSSRLTQGSTPAVMDLTADSADSGAAPLEPMGPRMLQKSLAAQRGAAPLGATGQLINVHADTSATAAADAAADEPGRRCIEAALAQLVDGSDAPGRMALSGSRPPAEQAGSESHAEASMVAGDAVERLKALANGSADEQEGDGAGDSAHYIAPDVSEGAGVASGPSMATGDLDGTNVLVEEADQPVSNAMQALDDLVASLHATSRPPSGEEAGEGRSADKMAPKQADSGPGSAYSADFQPGGPAQHAYASTPSGKGLQQRGHTGQRVGNTEHADQERTPPRVAREAAVGADLCGALAKASWHAASGPGGSSPKGTMRGHDPLGAGSLDKGSCELPHCPPPSAPVRNTCPVLALQSHVGLINSGNALSDDWLT
jgi:hypothetical protein